MLTPEIVILPELKEPDGPILFTTFAGALCVGAEIEILFPLMPTLTAPIPENASTLLIVPVELLNVFAPDAVNDILLV